MDRFYIVTNDGKDADNKITNQVQKILQESGKTCILCRKDEKKNIIKDSIPKEIDCAVVIGGDGSLIEVARLLHDREVSILGINMGTLGYLTEIEPDSLEEELTQILHGRYSEEKRMMLEAGLPSGFGDISLNDVVISRRGELRVMRFNLYVNGEILNTYEADGVIISTPTGSTAYNLSAGGPIVEPTAEMIVITPICSHALNTRSMVLSAEDELVIEIGEGRHGGIEEALVSFDGTDSVELVTGDRVTVRKARTKTRIIKLNKVSFLETLRRKMKGN